MQIDNTEVLKALSFAQPVVFGIPARDLLEDLLLNERRINNKKRSHSKMNQRTELPSLKSEVPLVGPTVYEFILSVCDALELEKCTAHNAIAILNFYLLPKIRTFCEDISLLAITCLWISSKIYDKTSLNSQELLCLCKNRFTLKDLIGYEHKVLIDLNFKTMMRSSNIVEIIKSLMVFIREIYSEKITRIIEDVSVHIANYIFSNTTVLRKFNSRIALAISIIMVGKILAMQEYSFFPACWRMAQFFRINYDNIQVGAKDLFAMIGFGQEL